MTESQYLRHILATNHFIFQQFATYMVHGCIRLSTDHQLVRSIVFLLLY